VEDEVMLRTFNLGVGMAAVARPEDADSIIAHLASFGVESYRIGEIIRGDRTVRVEGNFNWR
jgi:phosphoribosylformylglycinamidine cyclo-ligase